MVVHANVSVWVALTNNNNNNIKIREHIEKTMTISKPFRIYVINIQRKYEAMKLQKTAILGTAHILRKVLM